MTSIRTSRFFLPSLLRGANLAMLGCLGLLTCPVSSLTGQQSRATLTLPDAPGYSLSSRQGFFPIQQSSQASSQSSSLASAGTLSGTIKDVNGSLVPEAQITLTVPGQSEVRTTQSDALGRFLLTGLSPGIYKITVVSAGLQTYLSPELTLMAGDQRELPTITLAVATLNSSVQVTASEEQIAQAQIHAEEKQRVLGIAPDFFSSYIWDAAPLDAHQKFVLASKSAFDPITFLSIAAVAGIEQWRNTYPGYGSDAASYGKRFGASFADEAVGRFFASAIYPSLLHQDPRYFYKGSGTKTARAEYAITRVFVTRGNNGKPQPNYSLFLGRLTAGAIANLYHDSADRGAALTFENAFLNIGGHAFDNLFREFVFKHFTPNVPPFENGEASTRQP